MSNKINMAVSVQAIMKDPEKFIAEKINTDALSIILSNEIAFYLAKDFKNDTYINRLEAKKSALKKMVYLGVL